MLLFRDLRYLWGHRANRTQNRSGSKMLRSLQRTLHLRNRTCTGASFERPTSPHRAPTWRAESSRARRHLRFRQISCHTRAPSESRTDAGNLSCDSRFWHGSRAHGPSCPRVARAVGLVRKKFEYLWPGIGLRLCHALWCSTDLKWRVSPIPARGQIDEWDGMADVCECQRLVAILVIVQTNCRYDRPGEIRDRERKMIGAFRRLVRAHRPEQSHRIDSAIGPRLRRLPIEIDLTAIVRDEHGFASPPKSVLGLRLRTHSNGRIGPQAGDLDGKTLIEQRGLRCHIDRNGCRD
jgi:hypothetical protein